MEKLKQSLWRCRLRNVGVAAAPAHVVVAAVVVANVVAAPPSLASERTTHETQPVPPIPRRESDALSPTKKQAPGTYGPHPAW